MIQLRHCLTNTTERCCYAPDANVSPHPLFTSSCHIASCQCVSPCSRHATYGCLGQITNHFCAYPAHSRCAKTDLLDARTAVLVILNALDIANK